MTVHSAMNPVQKRQPILKRKWTYEDYLQLPEGKRFEIIYGELLELPTPPIIHQMVIGNLVLRLGGFVKKENLGMLWLAPLDVILGTMGTPIQPDISFVSHKNCDIVKEAYIMGAPDLVIEILSPSSVKRDRVTKFGVYENAGISEYWIINPKGSTVEIYTLENEVYELAGEFAKAETIVSPMFGELDFEAKALFPQE